MTLQRLLHNSQGILPTNSSLLPTSPSRESLPNRLGCWSLRHHHLNLILEKFQEIATVIKRAKASSSPSPFDQIPYRVFKRCPSMSLCLKDLFNLCWVSVSYPAAWKLAAIKLIGKNSATEDPTIPSNFRPIALTSCIGKLYNTILKDRWLCYMVENRFLDPSIQKAFMPATS